MRTLSIWAQHRAIVRKYDDVSAVVRTRRCALWHVRLKPADLPYIVAIRYLLRSGGKDKRRQPPFLHVTVIASILGRRSENSDEPIPHVWTEGPPPDLCLYDPGFESIRSEWNIGMSIADTIIPWASEWLYFYEL